MNIEHTEIEVDRRHGGPYDRGLADSYYQRGKNPHYYVKDAYSSPRIEMVDMTAAEMAEYEMGYLDNEADGNFKDWG